MSDKPMHYAMAPELAEYVEAADEKFAALLAAALGHLDELGAESNDKISALAHWTGLFVSEGGLLLLRRRKELRLDPRPFSDELNILLQDVLERAAHRIATT
jgi:hypothetical protein